MQLVDHDTFLRQLAALFEASKEKGSVWITHKRLTHDGEDASMAQADGGSDDKQEYPCILKVTDGGSNNFSTKVVSGELNKFYAAYGSFLKSAMSTLRKRDKKREKLNAEQAAKRKKRMTEPVKIDGPKRGRARGGPREGHCTALMCLRPVLLTTPSRSFGQYRLVTELAYRPGHKLHLVYTCSLHDRALAFYAVHIIIATQSLLLRIFQSLAGKAQPSDICNNSCASSSGTQLIAVVLLSWSMQVSTSPDTSYRTRSCLVVPTTGTYEDGNRATGYRFAEACIWRDIHLLYKAVPSPRMACRAGTMASICRELLDSVCSELSDDSKSLHSLLLTSRLFVEAALDALWREIFFEEPFAACLPEDTFRRKDAPALPRKFILVPNPDRQLTVSDLRRFQSYYAPRIRAIEPGGRGKYHFTPEFLQALIDITDGQHGALAPRLNRFTWDYGFIDSTHFLQYTTLLVGECVTSFRCSNSLRSRTLLRIVTSVTDRLPNLKILSLQLEHACSPFIEDLIKSNSLSSVRSLVIEGISFTAIPVLASLPQLEALKVLALEERSPQNDPRDPWASNSGHFGALRQLYIRCHDISTALNFLRHIPPPLRVFDCTCRASALEPSLSPPQAILDVIVGHISRHSLEVLKIRVGSENTRTTEVGDDTAAAGIDINSLFEFTNLRRVALHLAGRIQVSPSEVQRIVTAWTQLESLKLYGTLNIPRVALIDQTHLLTIAEGCPNLRELGVPFDGRHIQCSKRSANGPFPCVKTLHVAWSLDGYPSCREASFFTCNFPSAKLAWYF